MQLFKVRDPKRWFLLPAGEVIALDGKGLRPVRLEVNAVAEASFQVVYPDEKVGHLAAFKGMGVIEFVADGPVEVWVTTEAEVYFYTDDGRNIAFVNDGKVNFAVPHERGSENEQIIHMQALMLLNAERMQQKQAAALADYRERLAEIENSSGASAPSVPPAAGEPPAQSAADEGTGGVAGDGETS